MSVALLPQYYESRGSSAKVNGLSVNLARFRDVARTIGEGLNVSPSTLGGHKLGMHFAHSDLEH